MQVHNLNLAPGQRLLLGVKAADLHSLGKGPNVGVGDRWLLDVVTPEQLRTMLESRELVLRQRFEVILQEVTEMRDPLAQIAPAPADNGHPPDQQIDQPPPGSRPGAEPGDKPSVQEEPASPEQRRKLASLRIDRAMRNSRKNAHEIQAVAESFDDIRAQFVNNGIATEQLNDRLKQGIADPLHQVAEKMFPELQRRLRSLQKKLADPALAPGQRDLALKQTDAILLVMHQVLDRMIQLEDFNEVIELLRAIIDSQEKLQKETEKQHKATIRRLLEN
jgi:hypothetical protein